MLVARSANGGLPVARNTGFAAARGRYVFALDADNVLYPSGCACSPRTSTPRRPRSSPRTGCSSGSTRRGAVGLTSHLPWDVDLLVHGAYIDAMAMLRRDAWTSSAATPTAAASYGWEDYDLWLAAAERGWRADLVAADRRPVP